jgi:hypothetical protein
MGIVDETGLTSEGAYELATSILHMSLRPKLNFNSTLRFMYLVNLIALHAPSEAQRDTACAAFSAWHGGLMT